LTHSLTWAKCIRVLSLAVSQSNAASTLSNYISLIFLPYDDLLTEYQFHHTV
jgi:hypothetical protein